MDYWCKKDNLVRLNALRKNRYIDSNLLPYRIDSLKKLTTQRPENYKLKTELAHAYYVVNRSKKQGVKRVVVIAGANHRRYMQDILGNMPEVSVKNINEL